MRKGVSFSASLGIGMAIFVVTIASVFLLLQHSILPDQQFSQQVQTAARTSFNGFTDTTYWTVYETPLVIHSNTDLDNEPVVAATQFPNDIVPESVLVTVNGKETPSQHDIAGDETVFVTDLSAGANRVNLVYTKEGDLDDRTYTATLAADDTSVWNDRVNVTFTSSGIDQIEYSNLSYFASTADLGTASTPDVETELLRATVNYSDGTDIRMFDRAEKLRVTHEFSGERTWTFAMTSNFTTLYASQLDGTRTLEQTGTIYANTTDVVDLYNATGFGIIGDNLSVNVSRDTVSGPIDVEVTFSDDSGEKTVVLYPHDGDYTAAQAQTGAVVNPYTVTQGVPEAQDGVSVEQASSLEDKDYETVKNRLRIAGVEYNITVSDVFRKGQDIDTGATVYAQEFPLPVLHRYGNESLANMSLRVWSR